MGSPVSSARPPSLTAVRSTAASRAPGRFRFTHSIMQRYLYREIGAARRPELHTQVALALEDRQQAGRLPAAEIASHWLAAGGSPRGHALAWAVQAGDEAG